MCDLVQAYTEEYAKEHTAEYVKNMPRNKLGTVKKIKMLVELFNDDTKI